MRIYLSSIAPQVITDLNFIRPDLRLNVLQPFVFSDPPPEKYAIEKLVFLT